MINLSEKWVPRLVGQPETGMGYQVVTVSLIDGQKFDNVMIVGGTITSVGGSEDIPFSEDQIHDIKVTGLTGRGDR